MKFCENPKCLFHVDVRRGIYHHTIIPPEPVRSPFERVDRTVATTTREKHLWRNPKKGTEWFFCDVCHEAASMVREDD